MSSDTHWNQITDFDLETDSVMAHMNHMKFMLFWSTSMYLTCLTFFFRSKPLSSPGRHLSSGCGESSKRVGCSGCYATRNIPKNEIWFAVSLGNGHWENTRMLNLYRRHIWLTCFRLLRFNVFIYLEPKWPLFLKVNPQNKALSNQNRGHLGSGYAYTSSPNSTGGMGMGGMFLVL